VYEYWLKPPIYQVVDYQGDIAPVQAWLDSLDKDLLREEYGASNFRIVETRYGMEIQWDGLTWEYAGRHVLVPGKAIAWQPRPEPVEGTPVLFYLETYPFNRFEPAVTSQ